MNKPNTESIVHGALYDFAAYLTTRDEVLCFGHDQDCAPAAAVVAEFAKMRALTADPAITDWNQCL